MALELDSVYQITVKGIALGQAVVNVLNYAETNTLATPPFPTAFEVLGAFVTRWQATIIPNMPSQYSVSEYQFREITGKTAQSPPAPTSQFLYGDTAAIPGGVADIGTLVGVILPTYASWRIRWKTPSVLRRFRGGSSMGPIREADAIDNSLEPAFLTNVTAAAGSLRAPLTFVTAPDFEASLVIFTRKFFFAAPVPQAPVLSTSLVTGSSVNQLLGSAVSRKQRPGGA